jgi:hypothetical protein
MYHVVVCDSRGSLAHGVWARITVDRTVSQHFGIRGRPNRLVDSHGDKAIKARDRIEKPKDGMKTLSFCCDTMAIGDLKS